MLIEDRGDTDAAQRQQAEYCAALAEAAERELEGSQQTEWLDRLETEHERLRRALEWSTRAGAEPPTRRLELGLRLAAALKFFWERHSHLNEGREWLAILLAQGHAAQGITPPPAVFGKALDAAARLAYKQADLSAAQRLYDESLALQRQLASPYAISLALVGLGHLARAHKDLVAARAYYEEALGLRRALGDKWSIAAVLDVLGKVALGQGEVDLGAHLFEEALALCRELGDQEGIGYALEALGQVAFLRGDHARAVQYTEEAALLYRAQGNKADIADALDTLGWFAAQRGDYTRAATLLEEAIVLGSGGESRGCGVAALPPGYCAGPARGPPPGPGPTGGEPGPAAGERSGRQRAGWSVSAGLCRARGGARAAGAHGPLDRSGRCSV